MTGITIPKRVPADAVVDDLGPSFTGQGRWWRVTVRTPTWYRGLPLRRVYDIAAHSDTMAAQEGLRRFSAELDAPRTRVLH